MPTFYAAGNKIGTVFTYTFETFQFLICHFTDTDYSHDAIVSIFLPLFVLAGDGFFIQHYTQQPGHFR